jgi:flagellar biosynthesis component FlhA
MFTTKNLAYGAVAVAVAGIAVLAGMPSYFLLVLACPLMMLIMMASMSGGKTRRDAEKREGESSTRVPTPDGSHDHI